MIKKLLILLSLLSFLFIAMGASPNKRINIHTFEELPETECSLDNNIVNPLKEELTKGIGKAFLKRKHKTEYVLTIQYKDYEYVKVVTLPEEQKSIGTPKEMIGYYFTKNNKETGINRYLIYFTDKSVKTHDIFEELYENNEFKYFNIATYWNLTTGKYKVNRKMQVWGLITSTSIGYKLIVSMPFNTDNLLSITLDYRYFNNYIFGIKGAWQYAHYTVYNTDKYQVVYKPLFENLDFSEAMQQVIKDNERYGNLEYDLKIVSFNLNEKEKKEYINKFNKQRDDEIAFCKSINKECKIKKANYNEVFNSENKVYSVHLKNIDRFLQTGITFHEVSIIDLTYEYDGIIYQLDNEDIISNVPGYIPPKNDSDVVGEWFWDKLKKIGTFLQKNWKPILYVIAAIVSLGLLIYFAPVVRPIIDGIGRVLNKIFNRRRRK